MSLDDVRLNPGGALEPDQVIGRDELVQILIETLAVQGVLLVAERRSGKTSLLRLFEERAPSDWNVVKLSVEGVNTPDEFVVRLARATSHLLPTSRREWFIKELDRFGVTGVGGLRRETSGTESSSWKEAVDALVLELVAIGRPTVLLLDEFPFMIAAIARDVGLAEARGLLNVLRAARQEHPLFRMVLSGSIGLHHVLADVRDGSWAPINDLGVVAVNPLDESVASALATALLRNERVECGEDQEVVGLAVARATEGVPYYIHLLVGSLKRAGVAVKRTHVDEQLTLAVESPEDPWSLRHLERRVDDYYGGLSPIAELILDTVARSTTPITFPDLLSLLRAQRSDIDERAVRNLLDDLQRDHYLIRHDAAFKFRLDFIRRAWRSLRFISDETL